MLRRAPPPPAREVRPLLISQPPSSPAPPTGSEGPSWTALSSAPSPGAPPSAGATVVNFTGVAYTDGVTRSSDYVEITITASTPTLYYYCPTHQNMGGSDNNEAVLTIDPNNPKVTKEDGSWEIYQPDGMGYPTVVLSSEE